jgi:apolipoprotein N-acyltransferase
VASDPPASPPPALSRFPLGPRAAYGAAVLAGLLYWMAFPGKLDLGAWHGLLGLVAFVPLWLAMQGQTPKRALWVGVLAGATMNIAGFTWMLTMLRVFSGFPWYLCLVFVVLVCTYQGGRFGLMGWLFGRASARGWPAALVFVAAFAVSELAYPLLFPWYFAATAYQLPALWQTAELGGPILVGSILVGVNVALAEPLVARLDRQRPRVLRMVVPLAVLGLALAFAAVRIPQVDRRAQAAEAVHVGVVQGNLGLIEKREEPAESLRRHLELTNGLKERGVEFAVWSESSVSMIFPERGYGGMMREQFTRSIGMPAIFGSVLFSEGGLQQQLYNTALSIDARGDVTGRYDKEFLLAFGEYLPLGDTFPKLYEWSPNSGRFTPGTTVDPLPITLNGTTHPVSALICYEDILPSFTNHVVAVARPDLLVNMSNDAWFGDSSEPWEHLALAQLRAVEHRRYLVRSTNSGVSAIVDPVGRVMVHGRTFDAEALDAVVHWLHDGTVYEALGDTPWILLTAVLFAAAFVRRRTLPVAAAVLTVACSSSSAPSRAADAAASEAGLPDAAADAATHEAAAPADAGLCPAIAAVDFGGPSCDGCTAERCCPVATTCYTLDDAGGNSYCAVLAQCLAQCVMDEVDDGGADAEASCSADCQSEYGKGNAEFQAMQACLVAQCTNEAGTAPCNN